jgi:hypothetical protein
MRRVLLLLFCLLFSAPAAEAATLYMDPSTASVGKGGSISVAIRIDTAPGECINAVDGVIAYDPGLQVSDISTGQSIFSLWIEQPTFNNDTRTITFAGGVPNGYCGRVDGDPQLTNTIAEVIFRAPSFSIGATASSASSNIYFTEESGVYLNDGLGTRVVPAFSGASITLREEFTSGADDAWRNEVSADTIPPSEFSITLTKDTSAFQGDYFIVFNTTDKQTGIDHYEVIEEGANNFNPFGWGAATAPWVRAVSPYVLQDQSLSSTIRVKAIDKAGNEYVATLVPDESLRTLDRLPLALAIVAAFSVLAFFAAIWLFWRARRKRRLAQSPAITVVAAESEQDPIN